MSQNDTAEQVILFLVALGGVIAVGAGLAALIQIAINQSFLSVIWSLQVLLSSGFGLWLIYRFVFMAATAVEGATKTRETAE